MIKLILKQMWTQRAMNAWLWVELVVVFVCLSYLVDYLYKTGTTYFSHLGFDTEHVYKVTLNEVSSNSEFYVANQTDSMKADYLATALTRMRTYPGVESACVTIQAPGYSQKQSNGTRGIDSVWVHGYIFHVTPEFFRVFRVADKQGQIEPLINAARQEKSVIASLDAEKKFAAEGVGLLNSGIKNWNTETSDVTVRAITGSFRFNDFQTPYPAYYHIMTEAKVLERSGVGSDFAVRIRPGEDTPEFMEEFRKTMRTQLRLGNLYLLEVTSYANIRENYFRANGAVNEVKTHIAGLVFLLVNILLAVVGTFWIRTQQRRPEIALRMALGATFSTIRKELLTEGALLLLLSAVPGVMVCVNIVYFFELVGTNDNESVFGVSHFITGQLLTLGLMLGMVIIGILFPAQSASKIQPAEALHNE